MLALIAAALVFVLVLSFAGLYPAVFSAVLCFIIVLIIFNNGSKENPLPTYHDLTPKTVYDQVHEALRRVHIQHSKWRFLVERDNPRKDQPLFIHAEYPIPATEEEERSTLYVDVTIAGTKEHQTMLTIVWKPDTTGSRTHHYDLIDMTTKQINDLIAEQVNLVSEVNEPARNTETLLGDSEQPYILSSDLKQVITIKPQPEPIPLPEPGTKRNTPKRSKTNPEIVVWSEEDDN